MSGPERIVFQEQTVAGDVRVVVNGEIDADILECLSGFVERQRQRLKTTKPETSS